ncbi:hypothetical protein C6P46_004245 [Rhodotorula mucilaginosa]|uniref:Late embryogenesis abundant protein LEA-2 subgroup domain-containing protein n=1 Tax=Rhodotorula mucilaginosa TaxID=5537 RepID=A0A9P6WA77_RHOMI|nr:hypothetical protein C6P46_004245 [Rhodotorula mucilaginosa]TKA50339.1 hypothetical protein B0A53_06229 [Rhodotorula sp. CCFEE 5036]
MAYNHQQDYHSGEYPRQNMYADPSRPYADPPSPAAPDDYGHPDQYYHNSAPPPPHGGAYYDNMPYQDQYSAGDFISPERDGRGIPGGRQTTYPPASSDPDLLDKEDAFAYEKPALQQPVTRGSIAAQLAAEGQIPKKEGLRMFRKDEHAGALTRGGRMRCCGRVFCCSIMLIVLILVGIVAAFFLWVKPPDVTFRGIRPPTSGNEVSVQTGGFLINVTLDINVINPNFFGAHFSRVDATAYYPTKPNEAVGGGTLKNFDIKKHSNSTINFPFSINYTTSYDSDRTVLQDIARRCGFLGDAATQLKVNYKVKTEVRVIAVSIGPTFSSSASFDCPLTESDITGFLGSSGLSGLLNGGSSKLRERRRSFLSLGEEEASAPTEQERLAMHLATRHALAKLVERGSGGGGGGAEEEGGVRRRAEKMFVADRYMRIGTVRLAEHSSPSSSEEEARDD